MVMQRLMPAASAENQIGGLRDRRFAPVFRLRCRVWRPLTHPTPYALSDGGRADRRRCSTTALSKIPMYLGTFCLRGSPAVIQLSENWDKKTQRRPIQLGN